MAGFTFGKRAVASRPAKPDTSVGYNPDALSSRMNAVAAGGGGIQAGAHQDLADADTPMDKLSRGLSKAVKFIGSLSHGGRNGGPTTRQSP